MMGWAANQSYWFDDYKEALRKKKEVKDKAEAIPVDREKSEKLIAVCDLLDIDLNGLTRKIIDTINADQRYGNTALFRAF